MRSLSVLKVLEMLIWNFLKGLPFVAFVGFLPTEIVNAIVEPGTLATAFMIVPISILIGIFATVLTRPIYRLLVRETYLFRQFDKLYVSRWKRGRDITDKTVTVEIPKV